MVEPKYLDMLAKGLLWAVGRDPERDFNSTAQSDDDRIRALLTAEIETSESNQLSGQCCGDDRGKRMARRTYRQIDWFGTWRHRGDELAKALKG